MTQESRSSLKTHVASWLGLALITMTLFSGCSSSGSSYYEEKEIVYSTVGDVELKLDLAAPRKGRGPHPALAYVYGSGWGWNRRASRSDYAESVVEAAKRGYVAITIDYRRISEIQDGKTKYPFPAQIHDVKCAIRWLRFNARKYKVDPERIGVVGFSSSGHLALMVGLTDTDDGLEGNCQYKDFSSRVQAVANFSGETEIPSLFKVRPDIWIKVFLQGTPEEQPELYQAATPLTYITKDDPPVISIYGTNDKYIPIEQAYLLDNKMKEVGVPHELIVREGAEHQDYSRDEVVWKFLDDKLKRNGK